jgi:hypothetical protein
MKESDLSKRVMKLLRTLGRCPHRVESLSENGFPDIVYANGCIELKVIRGKLSKGMGLRPQQIAFWHSWWNAGGRGIVLAQHGTDLWMATNPSHLGESSPLFFLSLMSIESWL